MPYKDKAEYNQYMKGYNRAVRAAERNKGIALEALSDAERTHSAEDYLMVLNEFIDSVRIDAVNFTAGQRARTVALLIDTALRVLKAADHEKRIVELEQMMYDDMPTVRPVFDALNNDGEEEPGE